MGDLDDMAARGRWLATEVLEELDAPLDPKQLAYEMQRDRQARDALARFHTATRRATAETLIAAWDHASQAEAQLGFYAVGASGARLVGSTKVPRLRRDAAAASLRRRRIRVGGRHGGHEVVWVIDEHGLGVWSRAGAKASGQGDEITLASGGVVKRAEITAVVAFVDDDYVRRGVRLELTSGATAVVVDEHDELAALDPTFGRNELLMSDAWWVSYLGRTLAAWLRVPLHDAEFGATVEPAIAGALHDLAQLIDAVPPDGGFEPVETTFGFEGHRAVVRCSPSPAAPEHVRYAELRVSSQSGESTSSQWLVSGSNDEVIMHLRHMEAIEETITIARELLESQSRHGLR